MKISQVILEQQGMVIKPNDMRTFFFLGVLLLIASCKGQVSDQKILNYNEVYMVDGLFYTFYSNHLFSGIINYEGDTGYKIYVENGVQTKKCEYKADTLISCIESPFDAEKEVYIEYYPNGRAKIKGYYWLGKKHGRWFYYTTTGKIEKSGEFHYGNMFSVWRYYNPSGKVFKEEHYDPSGRLLKTIDW